MLNDGLQGGADGSVPANWLSNQTGTDEPMHVAFRQCNTYRLWVRKSELQPSAACWLAAQRFQFAGGVCHIHNLPNLYNASSECFI